MMNLVRSSEKGEKEEKAVINHKNVSKFNRGKTTKEREARRNKRLQENEKRQIDGYEYNDIPLPNGPNGPNPRSYEPNYFHEDIRGNTGRLKTRYKDEHYEKWARSRGIQRKETLREKVNYSRVGYPNYCQTRPKFGLVKNSYETVGLTNGYFDSDNARGQIRAGQPKVKNVQYDQSNGHERSKPGEMKKGHLIKIGGNIINGPHFVTRPTVPYKSGPHENGPNKNGPKENESSENGTSIGPNTGPYTKIRRNNYEQIW